MKYLDLDTFIIRILSLILAIVLIIYMKNDTQIASMSIAKDDITFKGFIGIVGLLLIGLINIVPRHTLYYFEKEMQE